MMSQYTELSLKVLKGLNKDAVANFSSNYLIVGSSIDCDVILSGFDEEERFFEVSLTDGSLYIRVLHKRLNIEGRRIKPSGKLIPYELYQLINIDDCYVAVGEKEAEWPLDIINSEYIDSLKSKSSFLPDITKIKELNLIPKSDNQKILVALVAFFTVGSVFLYTLKSHNTDDIQSDINENTVQLGSINSFKIVSPKPKSKRDIELEKIKNLAYGLLQTYGVNRIDLNLNNDGILFASGYVGSNSKWERAKASILEDIDAIKEINTNNIETFKERILKLNTLLQKDGLKNSLKLKADPENNRVIVSGELTNASTKKWKAVKNNFNSRYSGYPALKSNVTDIENSLKLSIRGVSIGKTKYFTSTSGKKYMVGSDLGNGFRVLKIEVDKIVLLFEGNEITIFYNDGSENKINTI
jgi:hypothetical protein